MNNKPKGELVEAWRLEFSEKQQLFNLAQYQTPPNTLGWQTIKEKCTSGYMITLQAFLDSKTNKKLTVKTVMAETKRLDAFIKELDINGFKIKFE